MATRQKRQPVLVKKTRTEYIETQIYFFLVDKVSLRAVKGNTTINARHFTGDSSIFYLFLGISIQPKSFHDPINCS